jgi:hypothetical protein
MRRVGVALLVAFLTIVGTAWAEAPTTICVPEHASSQVLSTNTKGECPAKVISKTTVKYKAEALPGTAELEKLDKILPHVSYLESGIGGKPTIQFSGVNVQIISGAGKTNAVVNGEGNLVIGYDENPGGLSQTGSHDLILGEEQAFMSYGGILAGRKNTISGPFASVIGGFVNLASGEEASVSGGERNTASAAASTVSGGGKNTASFKEASISGGYENQASGENASVTGGVQNKASAIFASVSGGSKNTASGSSSSIFGGHELKATGTDEAIP